MAKRMWVLDPHSGGNKIPDSVRVETVERLQKYAATHFAGRYTRLEIRFRGPLCYIDAFTEPDEPTAGLLKATGESRAEFIERMTSSPFHLCRLRYFDRDRWSLAFYTYSNEKYTPCAYANGTFFGMPEEALDIGGLYLN